MCCSKRKGIIHFYCTKEKRIRTVSLSASAPFTVFQPSMSSPAISKVMLISDAIAIKNGSLNQSLKFVNRLSNCLAPVIWVFTGDGACCMWSIASQQHLRRIISLTDDGFKSESRNTMFHKRAPSKDQRGVCSFCFTFNSLFVSRSLRCSLCVFVSLSRRCSLSLSLQERRYSRFQLLYDLFIVVFFFFSPFSLNVW